MEKSTFTKQYALLTAAVKEMRKAAGLTQRRLAKKLGREQTLVARVESGQRRLDLIEFIWFCKAMGVNPQAAALNLIRKCLELERRPRRSK